MKNLLKSALILLLLAVSITACTEKEAPKEPQIPVVAGESFTARYGVPLSTGRATGENQVVDATRAAATNVAELKPTITKLIQDALDGQLATYPDVAEAVEQDPKTHLQRVVAKMAADGRPEPELADMTISCEVNYTGVATKGSSQLTPASIDLIWVDPAGVLPDYLLARVQMKDVANYNVQQGAKSIPLRHLPPNPRLRTLRHQRRSRRPNSLHQNLRRIHQHSATPGPRQHHRNHESLKSIFHFPSSIFHLPSSIIKKRSGTQTVALFLMCKISIQKPQPPAWCLRAFAVSAEGGWLDHSPHLGVLVPSPCPPKEGGQIPAPILVP